MANIDAMVKQILERVAKEENKQGELVIPIGNNRYIKVENLASPDPEVIKNMLNYAMEHPDKQYVSESDGSFIRTVKKGLTAVKEALVGKSALQKAGQNAKIRKKFAGGQIPQTSKQKKESQGAYEKYDMTDPNPMSGLGTK